MRIKKVSQTVPTSAQVVDGASQSTTDAYSCNYVNENFVTEDDFNDLAIQKNINTNVSGWYRIAKIQGTGHPANTAILSISSTYIYTAPCSVLVSVLTSWEHAKITQINALNSIGSNPAITKVRIQYDSTGHFFYVDAYYNLTTNNGVYVRNENILKSTIEILTPAKVTTEYTTLQELTITY